MVRAWSGALLGLLALSCAVGPPVVDPSSAALWGRLELVPREGVPAPSGGSAYGDRRLRGAVLVDYSKPGFAVVYVDGRTAEPVAPAALHIEDGPVGAVLRPRLLAQRRGGAIEIENHTTRAHTVSSPERGFLQTVEPGGRLRLPVPESGELGVYLLDVPTAESRIFVSPGPFTVVSRSGHYELTGLAPGPTRLGAWHPRFPPVSVATQLEAGAATRVDLQMGVGSVHPDPEDSADVRR
jgi:hypothetical protein